MVDDDFLGAGLKCPVYRVHTAAAVYYNVQPQVLNFSPTTDPYNVQLENQTKHGTNRCMEVRSLFLILINLLFNGTTFKFKLNNISRNGGICLVIRPIICIY